MADQGALAGGDIMAAHLQHAAPIGVVLPYAGPVGTASAVAIAGSGTTTGAWLYCIGTAVSRTVYADLYAVIGTAYGVGDNSTTFNIPDLYGLASAPVSVRFPAGYVGNRGSSARGTYILDSMGGSDRYVATYLNFIIRATYY